MYWDEIKTNEMSIGQIVRMATRIFKANAKSIIITTFIIFIPINIATSLIPLNQVMNDLYTLLPPGITINYTLLDFTAVRDIMFEFVKWFSISVALQQFFGCIAIMGVTLITYQCVESNKLDYKFVLEETFLKWPSAVWVLLLSAIISIGLYFFLIIPSLIFLVYTNFMLYAIVIKKQKGLAALAYSFNVVRHRFWKSTFRILFIFIFQYATNYMLASAFAYAPSSLLLDFILICLSTFVSMFFWIVNTIWFLNYSSVEVGKRNMR